ncbi:unnamed protein product [Rhizoctonia solani]|uniref:Fungal-type protein kinase domain-containing protein n=1 Tax=Rhizoctonia solani TaxID=456999 RepID=A0A8H3H6A1_9AGAM|nr:unnamed protein product [Rhizoctonia solani]
MPSKSGPPGSNTKSSRAREPAARPIRRRGHHLVASQTETPPKSTTPPPKCVFYSTPTNVGQADTYTPTRRSAAGTPCVSSKTNNASYTHRSHRSMAAAPKPHMQDTMDIQIQEELRDTIFHDPNFVQTFLPSADDKLQAIEEHCRTNDHHYNNTGRWSWPERVTREDQLYQPVLSILNKIKRAVDDVHGSPPDLVPRSDDEPSQPEPFIDNNLHAIASDLGNTAKIKPDLVLFQDDQRHWENVRMPVEVKRLPGHHKAGMKQLSRYARAVFAHQLHRRHLYGLMVCGREASFVRFDRAGILYSGRIDMVDESELFTRTFASLLMLDRIDEGLDPAFTFRRNEDGRLVYYIDLPESELARLSAESASTNNKHPMSTRSESTRSERMRRFEVIERLCHRQSVCGRATIVLRIREVLEFDQEVQAENKSKKKASKAPKPREYALKLIWRDPQRDSEGDVLEQVHGMFGLPQHAGHWDVSMPGKCHCLQPVAGRCKESSCAERTVQVDGLQVCDRLRDISILVPDNEDGEEGEPVEVDTTECHATSYVRQLRIYSYILMSSIGIPLWRAESPHQFLTAVLDAVLGYWGLFNLGIMHRDVSEGNVLMQSEGQEFDRREWKEAREEVSGVQVKALVESEEMLRKVLADLGDRDPTGMLSDFDLHARHSSPSNRADSTELTFTSGPAKRSTREREEDTTSNANGTKRRKGNLECSIPVDQQEGDSYTEQEEIGKQRLIDYRTGTPAFMSTSVLLAKVGERYHHSFLDDLQSFFWLIIWSVAAHREDSRKRLTPDAQDVLNSMNYSDLNSLCAWKSQLLAFCRGQRGRLGRTLDGFGNKWGSSGMFRHVIFHLGAFLETATLEDTRPELESTPGDTILAFVKIIQAALQYEN